MGDTAWTVVTVVAGGGLTVAALLTLLRLALGPSMLDRTVAMDVLVTVSVAAIALQVAQDRDATALPVLVVLALVAFVGSVGVARFAAREPGAEEALTPDDGAGDDARPDGPTSPAEGDR